MLAVILVVAAGLRVWAPWDDVLGGARVNFLETDAWYHVRLVESQVRNFPHRVTVDPYAAPDGQYVAVAPLLDTVIATAVFVTQGRDASTEYIERVAAIVPAIIGVLAVVAVWALATVAFDRRAGFIAGLLAAVLPGHFLDRTLVGFVDHHALEVLLSFATLAFIAYGSVDRRRVCRSGCTCSRGRAARISSSSSRCGWSSPRSWRRHAARRRGAIHGDRGGHRARDRRGLPGSRHCFATTRRSRRWSD